MKRNYQLLITVSVCFLLTVIPVYYKMAVLELDFLPAQKDKIWNVEFRLKVQASAVEGRKDEYLFPIPVSDERVTILSSRYNGRGFNLSILRTRAGTLGKWSGNTPVATSLIYSVNLKTRAGKGISTSGSLPDSQFRSPIPVPPETESLIRELEADIIPAGSSARERALTLFHYISDEIVDILKPAGLHESLLQSHGSSLDKARLFNIMARRQGLASRIVAGLFLFENEGRAKDTRKRKMFYWNEIHLDGTWLPLSTTKNLFGRLSAEFIPLSRLTADVPAESPAVKLNITAGRSVSEKFDARVYRAELKRKKSLLLDFSLYNLPAAWHQPFRLLLLVPLGTLILSLARNFIGIKSFGIFMPILLALFFLEATLLFGTLFFIFVVAIGFLERYWLNRLYLLAVPRFSVLLILVIMLLAFSAVLLSRFNLTSGLSVTLFPIIITSVFIEKFSIMVEEEGALTTARILFNTLILAAGNYLLLSIPSLRTLLFTYPELNFSIIGLQILIGKYTGYRASEIWRFRDLLK